MGVCRKYVMNGLYAVVLSLVCVIAAGCGVKDAENAEQVSVFHIKILKIGKADTALLYMEGETDAMVIDTGEDDDGPEIVDKLEELGITRISHLIITHYDKDHIGGAAYVLEHMPVGQIIQPGYPKTGDRFEDYREAAETCVDDVYTVSEDMELTVGPLSLVIYSENDPDNQYFDEDEDNDRSLVTMVTYRNKRFLFTGDIEAKRIELMLASGLDLSCDWVKLPYHGSFNSRTENLLKATGAKDGVICCSEKNPAQKETLDAVRRAGMTCWLTADGDITFTCDGESIYGEQE